MDAAWQGSGIGTRILQFAESSLLKEGIGNITLLTDRNIPAEQFYKKNGFEGVDRLVFMHKRLKDRQE